MTLTFEEIKQGEPVLFLYHAGCGGEFVAKTFAENHPGYHDLDCVVNGKNQYHSIGPILYSSQWSSRDNTTTWLNDKFDKKHDGLNYVFKDHPTESNVEHYYKQMPDLNVIYMRPQETKEHFARLVFAKVSRQLTTPITREFIRTEVNHLLTTQQEQQLIDWSRQYPWVWSQEVMICNTRLNEGKTLDDFHHEPDLNKYVSDHVAYGDVLHEIVRQQLKKFPNKYTADIDSLCYNGVEFWTNMKNKFPDLNAERCINQTRRWIKNNHMLLAERDI